MKFLDLFAGIGGFRLALERAGHECVGFCEIDKFARQTYAANFILTEEERKIAGEMSVAQKTEYIEERINQSGEVAWNDITMVTDADVRAIGSVDIITGGFPCQAFSVAGKRGGFNDTRGTLFFDIMRITRIAKPQYLLLENVKGLLSHAGGDTLDTILNTMAELGYQWEYQVLNSKDFEVPQNRERVFIVGHLGGGSGRKIFPITRASGQTIKQVGNIIDTDSFGGNPQSGRVYDPRGISPTLNTMQGGGLEPRIMQLVGDRDKPSLSLKDHAFTIPANPMSDRGQLVVQPVLTPDRINKKQNGRRFKTAGEPMFTLTSQDRHGVALIEKPPHIPGPQDINNTVRASGRGSLTPKHNHDTIHDGVRIRRLTPLECFRLQAFPDEYHHKAREVGISDSQLYKQAGNAVTVDVVCEIAKRLLV